MAVDGFGGKYSLGFGFVQGDEFAIEHMRLYGSSHPQGFIFGLSGVLYDGVVSRAFFKNIAVFTAVDDDIVVHRLTVETA